MAVWWVQLSTKRSIRVRHNVILLNCMCTPHPLGIHRDGPLWAQWEIAHSFDGKTVKTGIIMISMWTCGDPHVQVFVWEILSVQTAHTFYITIVVISTASWLHWRYFLRYFNNESLVCIAQRVSFTPKDSKPKLTFHVHSTENTMNLDV